MKRGAAGFASLHSVWALAPFLLLVSGCGGGTPLLHPAQTLPSGDVRAAGGVSANVAIGGLASGLRDARNIAAANPSAAGASPDYAKGALVAAAIAPGLAPFVGARVGVGQAFEGGLAYTGRAVRVDMRRAFDFGPWALSIGVGGSAALYGTQQGSDLPNVDLGSLHGYGADLPVLVGWKSDNSLYMVWFGGRGGYEHDTIDTLTSEPGSLPASAEPVHLAADRFWGGAVLGVATGFNHVHVALELSAAYQAVRGTYNGNTVTVQGFTLAPATALWWKF
ncbi:MAG: hypothetical protein FWD69_03180 [Polyangiaceae bacterium]|nr:hypothetical protein [Polyangiaceae bacterium]